MAKAIDVFKNLFLFVFSGVLGLAAIVVPVLLIAPDKRYDAPLFPLLRTGIEGFSLWSAGGLALAGFILGLLFPRRAWLWGLGTVGLLPLAAFMEIHVDPTSHNLWPLEFFFYGVISLPAVAGACLGAMARKRKS